MSHYVVSESDGEAPFAVPLPKSSGELITVLAHYHRAEIARMAGWRDRLDRTTNWAITVIAAMLSVALSTANAHHGVLLFAMLLALLLLTIEARRYRFFDVYRNRVRLLEKYYYAHLFAPGDDYYVGWTKDLGTDLRRPIFRVRLIDAMGRRLRRNYIWMFLILILAWLLKICPAEFTGALNTFDFAHVLHSIVINAAVGIVPGLAVFMFLGVFYAAILLIAIRSFILDTRSHEVPVHV